MYIKKLCLLQFQMPSKKTSEVVKLFFIDHAKNLKKLTEEELSMCVKKLEV